MVLDDHYDGFQLLLWFCWLISTCSFSRYSQPFCQGLALNWWAGSLARLPRARHHPRLHSCPVRCRKRPICPVRAISRSRRTRLWLFPASPCRSQRGSNCCTQWYGPLRSNGASLRPIKPCIGSFRRTPESLCRSPRPSSCKSWSLWERRGTLSTSEPKQLGEKLVPWCGSYRAHPTDIAAPNRLL